jgi:hypothetical protein
MRVERGAGRRPVFRRGARIDQRQQCEADEPKTAIMRTPKVTMTCQSIGMLKPSPN